MFISMHITVDDVNFCDGLESAYIKYKSYASTASELPKLINGLSPVKTWLIIVCDTAFYAIIATNQRVVAAKRQQRGLVAVTIRGSVLFYSSAI